MSRKSMIHRRNGSDKWYVRVQVPLDLQELIGRKEIWRSLGTADRKLAGRLSTAKMAEIQQFIEIQRQSASREPTREELMDAVRRFYLHEVQADQDERALEPALVREQLKAEPHRYRRYAERLQRLMAEMDYSHVESDAELLLDYEGLRIPKGHALQGELRQLLMRARAEAARRWAEHDEGIFGEPPRDPFFGKWTCPAFVPLPVLV